MPTTEQLIIQQTIAGQEISRKCNAALLVYTDGHVVLQKNIKDNPQWASVGGKVDVKDQEAIINFSHHQGLERNVLALLRDQFIKADDDQNIAIFAYAALREAVEEIGGKDNTFIYNSLLNKKATLVRVNRDGFGIPEANKKFWTEMFYLDFGSMPAEELMENLKASGEKDCQEIIAAPINQLQTKPGTQLGMFVTTYRNGTDELEVRHTVGVIAKRLHALRECIAATNKMTTNDLLQTPLTTDSPLTKADLGAGLSRIFLPKGKADELANWVVVLGKRFNGQLKISVGGAIDPEDASFYAAAVREGKEEQFAQLPVTSETDCITHAINFNPKWGKPTTDGMLYYTFLAVEKNFSAEEITAGIAKMNQIAPVYFAINDFLTRASKTNPDNMHALQQEAKAILARRTSLSGEYQLHAELITELTCIANGQAISSKDLNNLTEQYVRIYSEYSFFTQVPYLAYAEALQMKKPLSCTNHVGQKETLALFKAESYATSNLLKKFEAKRQRMLAGSSAQLFSQATTKTDTHNDVNVAPKTTPTSSRLRRS